jgi:hypothetical protein
MAKITRVAKAQQRYEQVPVIDPETGQQKQTPVMRNGKQRVTKTGRPIFLTVTANDKSKPLPNRKCGKCGNEITVGSPYKHISPRSGPYGGRTLYRCASCPDWHVWEYSSSLSARTAEISHDFWESFNGTLLESQDDVTSLLNDAAERVREIASEKEESASNIEDGFGHATSMSEELTDVAEQLNSWADDIESADIPEYPEPEEDDCDECDGSGEVVSDAFTQLQADHEEAVIKLREAERVLKLYLAAPIQNQLTTQVEAQKKAIKALQEKLAEIEAKLEDTEATTESCEQCDGSGRFEPDEPTEDQLDEWRSEVESAVSVVDECPV